MRTLDPAALDRLTEWGGSKLLRQMARLYVENAQARLAQIERGLGPEGPLADAAGGAHSLKSSAANVGAVEVNRLAAEIERLAGAGDAAAARERLEPLKAALVEAERALASAVEKLPA